MDLDNFDLKEFEEVVDKLDKNEYRIIREIDFKENKFYWKVFRKNLKEDEYFDDKNLVILSSENNTIDDIKKLIK